MYKRFHILFFLAGTLSISSAFITYKADTFPADKVLEKFRLLINDTTQGNIDYINIDTESIREINDTILKQTLSNYKFYYLTIFDGSAYEYNQGKIQTIAAISITNKDDIRLLVPLDFTESGTYFTAIFLNKKVTTDKKKYCYAISNLFLETKRRNNLCCEKEIKDIIHESQWNRDTLVATIKYVEYCCDGFVKTKKSKMSDYTKSIITKYNFDNDSLVAIDYINWR